MKYPVGTRVLLRLSAFDLDAIDHRWGRVFGTARFDDCTICEWDDVYYSRRYAIESEDIVAALIPGPDDAKPLRRQLERYASYGT